MEDDKKEQARNELMKKVDYIDRQIGVEDSKLKQISTAQEHLSKLKENIDKCSEILSNSLEKGHEKQKFDNLVNEGNSDFTKAYGSFEEQADILRQKVSNLRNQREAAIREYEEKTYDEDDE